MGGVDSDWDAVSLQREARGDPYLWPLWVLFVTSCNIPASRGRKDSGGEGRWLRDAIARWAEGDIAWAGSYGKSKHGIE